MSEEMENVLRNALDAVDRGRRWAMLGVVALCAATLIAGAALFAIAASRTVPAANAGMMKALFLGSAAEMLLTACCAIVVMFHISRIAKTILRSLDPKDSHIIPRGGQSS